jgi:thiaminase
MPSLTSHLLHLDNLALKVATQHPFLEAAATSSLPEDKLKAWLGQDRLYALSYANFIGALIAKTPIPTTADRETTLEWRAVDLFIDCLTNIRNEVKLFEETAEAEGWLDEISNASPSVQTRAYQDLFAGAASPSKPLLVGLTVLWATEECYLRSWRYSQSKMDQGLRPKDKDIMQRSFIPNWSSPEFEAFVRRMGGLVNKFGTERAEEDSWEWQECETAWRQVVWLEKEFWPEVKNVRIQE